MDTPPPDINWYRTPVEPALLDELNQRHDGRGLIQALGHLALFVATGTACWFAFESGAWLLLALALLAHGTVASFMAAANHELLHDTVFSTPSLNKLFLHLFSVLVWENPYRYRASHMEHHKYTLHFPADSDEVLPRSVTVRDFLNYAVIDWRNIYSRIRRNLRFSFGLIEDTWDLHLFPDPERRRILFNWSRMVIAFHVATTAIAFHFHLWFLPVIVSGAPAFGRALFFIVNNTQHLGLMEGTDDFRLGARTIRMNPLVRFLYWQMNYHIEHHMYPAVPCYKLARLHEAIKHDLPPPMNGLIATWQQIIAVQYRQQKEDPGYRYRQAIPGAMAELPAAHPPAASASVAPARRVPQRGKSTHRSVMSAAELRTSGLAADLKVLECAICGFIYDEALGLPEEGLAPGTRWADIPDDWRCPHCGIRKSRFKMVERV